MASQFLGTMKIWFQRTLLDRGESVVASSGLTLAALLLFALGASGWWTLAIQRDARQQARQDQVETLAAVLREYTETMLAGDELSGLRRVITSVARTQGLTVCRISLLDGGVIADGDPSRITTLMLPDRWPEGAGATPPDDVGEKGLRRTVQLVVPGRGTARLELHALPWDEGALLSKAAAGVGLIGAVTLVLLLLVYRRMRRRFMAIGSIRESLLALQRGEVDETALLVNRALGAEADAWNELLSQRATSRRQELRKQSIEQLTNGAVQGGDLASLGDAMWLGLLVVDENLRISFANGAAAVLLQMPRESLAGADLAQVIDDDEVVDAIRAASGDSMRGHSTIEMPRGEGTGDGLLRADMRTVQFGGHRQTLVVIEDVTQQRVADEARNSFVTQVTHELRAPLTNIRLYVNTAIEDGEQDPILRGRALNVINQEARRLERIVNDMLSVAEIEAGSLALVVSDVRLDSVFKDLHDDYGPLAEERSVSLAFDLPPKMPVMQGDRDKLVLALHNLLNNALKYTQEGGSVRVVVAIDDRAVTIRFVDTGIGIDEADRDRIFDKFQRAKDPRVESMAGSGLGLALVREIVTLHGGTIEVDSELNVGSTFIVRLPLDGRTG